MNVRRAAATVVVFALAVAASACGGSSSGSASGGSSGAEQAPASAPIFISMNTDVDSDQWKTLDKLVQKFPGHDKLTTQIRQSMKKDSGVDWETDVKPALGPEVDIVFLDLKDDPTVVGLTQPKDEKKFDALVKKANASDDSGNPAVTEKVGDWTVISDSQAKIDAFKRAAGGDKLSDDDTFTTATGTLSDDALAKVYVNGPPVQQALQQRANATSPQVGKFDWAAAEVVAQDEGMKLDGTVKGEPLKGTKQPASYSPKLLDVVPSGALAVLDFKGGQNLDQLGNSGAPQLQSALQIVKSITPIFANESVIYVAQGTPFPEVTLVATPKSPQQAVQSLTQLARQLGAFAGGIAPKQTQIGGKTVMELNFGQFAVDYGVVDGKLVVTSSRRAITGLGSGSKLADDAVFKDAKSTAGMPDKVGALWYVNLKDGIPVIESFAQLGGQTVPPDVSENTRPLQSFIAYATGDGSETKFTSFLRVK